MLNADQTSNPLVGEHLDSELAIREAGVPFTLLRNGLYLERYTHHLSEYLQGGEIVGAAGHGRISAASRQDYAAAAAAALLHDEGGNRTPSGSKTMPQPQRCTAIPPCEATGKPSRA